MVRMDNISSSIYSSTCHYKSLERLAKVVMAEGASWNINLNENMDIENNSKLYATRVHATTTPPHNNNVSEFLFNSHATTTPSNSSFEFK
jgi:hypothetical protein